MRCLNAWDVSHPLSCWAQGSPESQLVGSLGTAVTVLLTSAVWSGLAEQGIDLGGNGESFHVLLCGLHELLPWRLKNSFVLLLTGSHCTALTDLLLIL